MQLDWRIRWFTLMWKMHLSSGKDNNDQFSLSLKVSTPTLRICPFFFATKPCGSTSNRSRNWPRVNLLFMTCLIKMTVWLKSTYQAIFKSTNLEIRGNKSFLLNKSMQCTLVQFWDQCTVKILYGVDVIPFLGQKTC